MKSAATIWLSLIIYLGLGTALNAQRSGENAAERERKKLSVILLVQGTVKAAENQPIDTQSIYDEINGNKGQHQEKERSSLLSRSHIEKEFVDGLQNRLDEIFRGCIHPN